MNDQNDDIIAELERRWPSKFTDDELADLAPRLERFKFQDVIGALEMHKARSKFKPTWAELLAALKVVASSNAAESRPARAEQTFPEMLATRFGDSVEIAVLLHWRKVWVRYANDAVDRREGMPPGPTLNFVLRQFAGMRAGVLRGVVSGLIAAGADPTWATGIAEVVTAEPREFDAAVAGLKLDGVPLPRVEQHQRPPRPPIFGQIFHGVPPLVDGGQKHRQLSKLQATTPAETEVAHA